MAKNVREKSLEVHNAFIERDEKKLQQLRVEFSLILNPEDKKIIENIHLPEQGKEE